MDGENTSQTTIEEVLTEFSRALEDIQKMIELLGSDCKEHYSQIRNNDSQLHRRSYVRSVFAFIEGVLHPTKAAVAYMGSILHSLSAGEIIVLSGVTYGIDGQGNVLSQSIYPTFRNNVKLAFKMFSKSIGSSFELRIDGTGWRSLVESLKVRDRLMHPKEIADLNVTDAEIEATKRAFEWFLLSHALCTNYAQQVTHAKSSANPEVATQLDARIQKLEANLLRLGD